MVKKTDLEKCFFDLAKIMIFELSHLDFNLFDPNLTAITSSHLGTAIGLYSK